MAEKKEPGHGKLWGFFTGKYGHKSVSFFEIVSLNLKAKYLFKKIMHELLFLLL
jgi:hypothetical protein